MANEKRRLIDANALRETIESKIYWGDIGLLEAIDDAPTVAAVKVVRCRDCISRVWDSVTKECWCDNPLGLCAMLKDGDFCSYGERKDDEH